LHSSNSNLRQYWLLKSEPHTYSIEDLQNAPSQKTVWEGVRNYQARNYLREMQKGEEAFFYHSSCAQPAIMGTVLITRTAFPDPSACDPTSPYYDPKSSLTLPRWFMVEVQLKQKFTAPLPLSLLKENPALAKMPLVQKGNRLSVMPVRPAEWKAILTMFN